MSSTDGLPRDLEDADATLWGLLTDERAAETDA